MSPSPQKSQTKYERFTKAQLKEELIVSKNVIEKMDKELNSLRKQLKEAEDQKTKLKAQQQDLEDRIIELETTNADLNEKMVELENDEESIPEDFSAKRSAFQIQLYSRQGHYEGKIEHPLTKHKKRLIGLDNESIVAFISEHLPEKDEEPTEAQSATFPVAEVDNTETTDETESTQIKEFNIIPAGAWRPTAVIPSESPFLIQLTLEPSKLMKEQDTALDYKLSILAKRLEGGFRQIIGEVKGEIKTDTPFKTKISSAPLPSGTYRFEAVGTMSQKDKQLSIDAFRKSSLINVL